MPPVAVTEFQAALTELAARSGEASDRLLARIAALSPAEARAFITDAYPALLTPYMAASGELTAQWYAEQPVAESKPGSKVFVPTPAPLAAATQLGTSGRWALTQTDPAVALRGNATRQVFNASRQTVEFNARAEGARWIRKAKQDACGFCKMLATRAALQYDRFKGRDLSYASTGVRRKLDRDGKLTNDYTLVVIGRSGRSRNKTDRARKLGSEYHDHCRCTAVPLRDGIYDPPDYVERWTDEYIEAFDKFGGDAAAISQALDIGRIRPDRITAVAEDVATATTAAAPAAPAVTAPPAEPAPAAPAAPVDPITAAREVQNAKRLVDVAEFKAATANINFADVAAQLDAKQLPPAVAKEAVAELDELDQTIADAMAALENGDEALSTALFDKAEKLEAAQKAKAARVAAKQAADDAERAAKLDRVGELIDEGYTPAQAEAEVFNVSVESIWRRDFILQARADGHQGAGFDELLTSVHKGMVEEWFWKAEAEVSVMIQSKFIGKFDPMKLWSVNEATARKVMSEEMAAWFDANGGRITRAVYRDSVLSDADTFDTNMTSDFLQ